MKPTSMTKETIYHLGESHCLSFAHQKIKLNGKEHVVVPRITFCGKAFHFSRVKEDIFKAVTKVNFCNIPDEALVFTSFGEIDCRANEGLIMASEKSRKPLKEIISSTVEGYVSWFAKLNRLKNHRMHFFNIPAPVYNPEVTPELNTKVAKTILEFNKELKKNTQLHNFKLIDVHSFTVGDQDFSNESYEIDGRHLGPNVIPLFELDLI